MTSQLDTPDSTLSSEQIRADLKKISPLALTQKLIDYELYDMRSSLEILDEVYKEFEGGPGVLATMAEPVAQSLVDASLRALGSTLKDGGSKKNAASGNCVEDAQKKYGITSAGIWNEIKVFKYPEQNNEAISDQAEREFNSLFDEEYDKSVRSKLENKSAMDEYKDKAFTNKKIVKDEYGTGQGLRKEKKHVKADSRINDKNVTKHWADTDHIVPLKQVHEWTDALSSHLTDSDKRRIANSVDNLALTSANTNRSKRDKSNSEFAEGKQIKGKHRDELLAKEKQAKNDIQKDALATGALNAGMSGVVPTLVVPLGFEIYDMMSKGFCHDLPTDNPMEAVVMRLKRAGSYIWQRLPDLLKNVGSNLCQLIVDLVGNFIAGLLKKFKRIIVEGFSIIVQALRIFSQPSEKTSMAQKFDAVSKLLVGPATALAIDSVVLAVLEEFKVPSPFSDILSAVVAACISSALLYLLDKLDLFSAKSEKRLARVKEIFDLRIKGIKESTKNFEIAAFETLKAQRLQFEDLRNCLSTALVSKNMEALNSSLDKMASFFDVKIPYASTERFLSYIRSNDKIVIGASE